MKLLKSLKHLVLLNIVARVMPPAPFVTEVCKELEDPCGGFGVHSIKRDGVILSVGQATNRMFLHEAGTALYLRNEREHLTLQTNFFEEVPITAVERAMLERSLDEWTNNVLDAQ